jgi:hypothetical protein
MKHYNIQDKKAAIELMSRDSRVVARQENLARLTGRNPDAGEELVNEERILLPFEVEFDFVSKEYDPIWYGARVEEVYDEEYHLYIELKAHSKDGYKKTSKPGFSPACERVDEEEEEEVDDASTIKTSGIPDHIFIQTSSCFQSWH